MTIADPTPLWPAEWTAIGTVALAAVTVAVIITTVMITVQDRKRADRQLADERERHDREITEERALADKRFAEQLAHSDAQVAAERDHSAARLREERDHAEEVRRRERQADNARILIQRIAQLQPFLDSVQGGWIRRDLTGVWKYTNYPRDAECRDAIESLRHGAFAEAPLLGEDKAAQEAMARYRFLLQLVLTAANDNGSDRARLAGTLRTYARWVRISLRMLAESQTVPPIYGGSPEHPLLGLPDHMPLWQPNPIPPGWNEEADTETAG